MYVKGLELGWSYTLPSFLKRSLLKQMGATLKSAHKCHTWAVSGKMEQKSHPH